MPVSRRFLRGEFINLRYCHLKREESSRHLSVVEIRVEMKPPYPTNN